MTARLAAIALGSALLLVAAPALAQLHKCKAADGSTSYQQTPCTADQQRMETPRIQAPTRDPREAAAELRRNLNVRGVIRQEQPAGGNYNYDGGSYASGGASADDPRGYECSHGGRTWVQATPCPATKGSSIPITGTVVGTGERVTGHARVQTEVQQRGLNKSDVCTRMGSGSRSGGSDSAYERNKMRDASGC